MTHFDWFLHNFNVPEKSIINNLIMNTIATSRLIFSKKIICQLFGHRIITTKNITKNIKEFRCTVCNLELTNTEKGQRIFLTPELKDINETLSQFIKKRMMRAHS